MDESVQIILASNYDEESVSEILVSKDTVKSFAQQIVKIMNNHCGPDGTYYYKVVPLDYKLHKFQP
jgi:hypothetical protein